MNTASSWPAEDEYDAYEDELQDPAGDYADALDEPEPVPAGA